MSKEVFSVSLLTVVFSDCRDLTFLLLMQQSQLSSSSSYSSWFLEESKRTQCMKGYSTRLAEDGAQSGTR